MNNFLRSLQKNITLKYVVAILFIVILVTLALYIQRITLKESNHTRNVVGMSAKQRMLSQAIPLYMYRIHENVFENNKYENYVNNSTVQKLISNIDELSSINKKLTTGKLSNYDTYKQSNIISSMYFGEMDIAKRVQDYVLASKEYTKSYRDENSILILNRVDLLSQRLAEDLGKLVKQYEDEGNENLLFMKNLELLVWIAVIITLILEVIFIFQPMVRKIMTLKSQNNSQLDEIEHTIKVRTAYLEEVNAKLLKMASHDALTGLKNRLNLERDIELAIEKSFENNAPYAVLMFDIDWFKEVNDTFGHDVGDMVIKEFALRLLSVVRDEDNVYRTGGEEFVILLNKISYENTMMIAHKIRMLMSKHVFKVNDEEFTKTVSGGVYHSSMFEVKSVKSVLKLVDSALYESKNQGRNRISTSEDDL